MGGTLEHINLAQQRKQALGLTGRPLENKWLGVGDRISELRAIRKTRPLTTSETVELRGLAYDLRVALRASGLPDALNLAEDSPTLPRASE